MEPSPPISGEILVAPGRFYGGGLWRLFSCINFALTGFGLGDGRFAKSPSRSAVTSLEKGHFNEHSATIDLQSFANRLIEEPCFG